MKSWLQCLQEFLQIKALILQLLCKTKLPQTSSTLWIWCFLNLWILELPVHSFDLFTRVICIDLFLEVWYASYTNWIDSNLPRWRLIRFKLLWIDSIKVREFHDTIHWNLSRFRQERSKNLMLTAFESIQTFCESIHCESFQENCESIHCESIQENSE